MVSRSVMGMAAVYASSFSTSTPASSLSPVIVLLAMLFSLASSSSGHNAAVVELCFNGGVIPENMPAEYAACIRDMQDSFALLDGFIEEIKSTHMRFSSILSAIQLSRPS